jgi:hypothetical protein
MLLTLPWRSGPFTSEETQAELNGLIAMHHIMPILAYNLQGKLIKPDAYRH